MKTSTTVLCLAAVGLMAGCVVPPMVGSKPGDVPPKIIIDSKSGNKTWDNPGAFGSVPEEFAAKGQATCSSLDTKDVQYKAIGYHPKATDMDGNPFPGGGYFCARK